MQFSEGVIENRGELLDIEWKDGKHQHFSAAYLRSRCPCARCREAAFPLEASMFPGLKITRIDPVGAYAFQFTFSDGHSQGAFSYDWLLELEEPLSP